MSTEASPKVPGASSPRLTVAPSPVDRTSYQKLPIVKDVYLAYVVAIRDPLNLHLDIYWPQEMIDRYSSALNYEYTFVSEELDKAIHSRKVYSCHLRGIEIITNEQGSSSNTKDAYILISSHVMRAGGWVLVSVSDIDIYRRVLVNVFDVVTRNSINQNLLDKVSKRTGEHIAKEYIRPVRSKPAFSPSLHVPKDYHIVYGNQKEKIEATRGAKQHKE